MSSIRERLLSRKHERDGIATLNPETVRLDRVGVLGAAEKIAGLVPKIFPKSKRRLIYIPTHYNKRLYNIYAK